LVLAGFPNVVAYLNSSDVYGRRLSIFFNASHQPVLTLDGVQVKNAQGQNVIGQAATGTPLLSAVAIGVRHLSYPQTLGTFCGATTTPVSFADQCARYSLLATSPTAYVVSTGFGPVGRGMIERHRKILLQNMAAAPGSTAEPVLGESLAMLGYTWLAEVARI